MVEYSLVWFEATLRSSSIDIVNMFDAYAKYEEVKLRKNSVGYFEDYKALFLAVKKELRRS